ncbi:MAG: hypothetical protein JO215_06775 [Ktedonobacteraceae bacterium]|nr:hypothetical protein [Ktedonobacteraceae bacterium]MBV9615274.1 hypothetical protein [Ktedonobacteraceae bacterium]
MGASRSSLSLLSHLSSVSGAGFHVAALGGTHFWGKKRPGSAATLGCKQNNYRHLDSVHT